MHEGTADQDVDGSDPATAALSWAEPSARPTALVVILLAACAGVVDLWAITSLAGTFAGVVTGNLVGSPRASTSSASPDRTTAFAPIYGDGRHGANPNPGQLVAVIDLATRRHIGRTMEAGVGVESLAFF
jgi:hypothetical protein